MSADLVRAFQIHRKRCSLAVVLMLAMVSIAACDHADRFTYKYKLTVKVIDGGREITGANVVRVTEIREVRGGARRPELCGAALFIPLSNKKILIATLNAPNGRGADTTVRRWRASPTYVLLSGYRLPTEWFSFDDSGLKQLEKKRGAISMAVEQLPEFLTFRNAEDPLTVAQLDPSNLARDLGPGVKFVEATIEPTDEPVTPSAVKTYLRWFDSRREYLGNKRFGEDVAYHHTTQLEQCD